MATFAEQFEKIAARYGSPEIEPEPEAPKCSRCYYPADLNEADLCPDCQADIDRGYIISTKAGRCANGAERDHGKIFHIRMLDEHGLANWEPLCGSAPGPRSAGWSEWKPVGQRATCERCLRRMSPTRGGR